MTPTPAQITRLHALPLVAHQRLVEQEGPGWLISPLGQPFLREAPKKLHRRMAGWVWLPGDSAALMRAATPEGGWWLGGTDSRGGTRWTIYRGPAGAPDDDGDILADAPTALDCALSALEAATRAAKETPCPT